jgi:hypothetical protein
MQGRRAITSLNLHTTLGNGELGTEPAQWAGVGKMSICLRRGKAADATTLGEICYSAFKAIADAHNFPPDFPSPDAAAALLSGYLNHDGFFDVVAEVDGKIVGSNFLDERNPISGLGPITVAPAVQNEYAEHQNDVCSRRKDRIWHGFRGNAAAHCGFR